MRIWDDFATEQLDALEAVTYGHFRNKSDLLVAAIADHIAQDMRRKKRAQVNEESASRPSSGNAPVIMGCQLPMPTPPTAGSVMRTTVSRI